MATFELQDQAGKSYEIDAPDQQSAIDAFKNFNNVPSDSAGRFARPQLAQTPEATTDTIELPSFGGQMRNMAMGVPVLGEYFKDSLNNKEVQDYQKNFPGAAASDRIVSGALATAPLAYGAAAATGAKLLPQILGQGTLNAGLNVGDRAAQGNASKADLVRAAIVGGLSGVPGPVIGKAITPNQPLIQKITKEAGGGNMAAGRKMIKAEPAQYESEIASGVNNSC